MQLVIAPKVVFYACRNLDYWHGARKYEKGGHTFYTAPSFVEYILAVNLPDLPPWIIEGDYERMHAGGGTSGTWWFWIDQPTLGCVRQFRETYPSLITIHRPCLGCQAKGINS